MIKKKTYEMPKFKSESKEADWWASRAGREFVRRKSEEVRAKGIELKGSSILAKIAKKSVQIAIRLPAADLAQARKIADRKGIGYQTLVKMILHEGLEREARRA